MAVNSSSLLLLHLSSIDIHVLLCSLSAPASLIYFSFYTTNIILLLPLCTFVLYLGVRRWRQQRSASSAAATSHSDAFTYHMVVMELVSVLGSALCCYGIGSHAPYTALTGYYLSSFTWYGESFFHIVICVEHHLAVVHPVTYRGLKGERGIRIRNATIGCVWLLSVLETGVTLLNSATIYLEFCTLSFSLAVISFCSLSVLCALIRPAPGRQGGDRDMVDQSKRKAFYTILAIMGVLFVRCGWNLISSALLLSVTDCVTTAWPIWFSLPSSLVLPLLFLLRAGRLTCCKDGTNEDGDQM